MAFDVNVRQCVAAPNATYLTQLEGTNWVTANGNFSNVLKQRAGIVAAANGTHLPYCHESAPYYDGIQCINCDYQFNLTLLKCVSSPNGTVYDDNLHTYVVPENHKQTNVKASNLLSDSPLMNNTSVPDCNLTNPFYDGNACISCPQPFILFDVSTKTCVTCESDKIYNSSTLKCDKRPITLISTNFNNLLGTPSKSIPQFKADVLDKVNNSDTIINQCSDPNQYSNYSACFTCRSNEYFNVETLKCFICNGTIDPTTKMCIPRSTLITNLTTAPHLLVANNKTLKDYANDQNKISGPIKACPNPQPYAVSGTNCISCPNGTYFNLSSQACVPCPTLSAYNSTTNTCVNAQLVSNLSAIPNYI